jgi:hypothetical protein
VLGGDAKQRGRAAADENRWLRSVERLGVAEGSGEPDVGAGEVERLCLRPQSADGGQRFGEAVHRMREVMERQAVCFVLTPGERVARSRAGTDTEIQSPSRDDVHGRGDLGQHRWWPEAVTGDGAVNLAGARRDRGVQRLGGLGVGGMGQAAAVSPVTSFQTANRRVISVR